MISLCIECKAPADWELEELPKIFVAESLKRKGTIIARKITPNILKDEEDEDAIVKKQEPQEASRKAPISPLLQEKCFLTIKDPSS